MIRTVLAPRFEVTFFSVSELPEAVSLAEADALVVEPQADVLEWLGEVVSSQPTLAVYLFCSTLPKGNLLNQFFRLDIKGCFTEEESQELIEGLSPGLPPADAGGEMHPAMSEWGNQLRKMGFITQCPKLFELFESVKKVAKTDATVLITGENGTGKEVVARIIHKLSPRAGHAFMAVHSGAIPENLLESELFGHVRGAFTSAVKDRKGKFEASSGGTIFLDEISTMPPSLQVKLLRVLQYKQFERVGDNQLIKADVRIVSATNSDLMQMVAEGRFREDLFYRLNVVPINIPPLRERVPDIAVLATHFIDMVCRKYSIPHKKISLGAIRLFQQYRWPGNVRQLENIIERMVVLHPDVMVFMPRHVPQEVTASRTPVEERDADDSGLFNPQGLSLPELIRNIEKRLILESLQKTQWNKQQAARMLKIKRTTLIEKMKRLEEKYEE